MKKRSLGILVFCLLLFGLCGTAFAAEKTKSPYCITVNLTANVVTVYEKDAAGNYTVPIKAFRCSGGTDTPEGTFRTSAKYEWRALYGNVWGQYATRITGPYLFHSVPYFEKGKTTLEYDEFNKLGTTASAGYIRLTVRDVSRGGEGALAAHRCAEGQQKRYGAPRLGPDRPCCRKPLEKGNNAGDAAADGRDR